MKEGLTLLCFYLSKYLCEDSMMRYMQIHVVGVGFYGFFPFMLWPICMMFHFI